VADCFQNSYILVHTCVRMQRHNKPDVLFTNVMYYKSYATIKRTTQGMALLLYHLIVPIRN